MNGKEEMKLTSEWQGTPRDDDPQIFNLRTLLWFLISMVGMIVFILFAGALLSSSLLSGNSVVITPAATLLPPEPRLEIYPAQNFPALHATQEAGLNSYGWVDRQNGIVHIPVERAMELIAASNLPVAGGTPVAVTPFLP